MGRLLNTFAVLLFVSGSASAQGEADAKVEVDSLEIRKILEVTGPLPAIPRPVGTTVGLRVKLPKKHLIEIDGNAGKKANFTHDKGADLGRGFFNWDGVAFARIGGTECAVTAFVDKLPTKGASKLRLKGEIVFLCGTEEKTLEIKNVDPTPNKSTPIGSFLLVWEAKQVGGRGSNSSYTACKIIPNPTTPSPKSKEPLVAAGAIKKVEFVTADGKQAGSPTMPQAYPPLSFSFAAGASSLTVRVTYFAKFEKVTVPVDLQVGVGF